jgi:hypothetical protein
MFIRKFFAALWADWVAAMSGGVSVALAFWAVYFPPTDIKAGRILLWAAAVICVVYASYRIWASEHRKALALEEEAKRRQPKLIGFFQDFRMHDWTKLDAKDEDIDEERVSIKYTPARTMFPSEPTGTLVVVTVGFVNDSQTPTTLINFSLTLKVGDKTFTAMYPEEMPEAEGWTPPEIAAKNKERQKANLVNYLDTRKPALQGRGIQGFLTFYLDGCMWEEFVGQDWFFTLTITDAWHGKHDIVHWGEPPRPSQRI